MHIVRRVLFIPLLFLTAPLATGAEEKSAEDYLREAAGVLHHTCRTVEARYGGDDAAVVDVIEKMIAVSLFNRAIDFTQMSLTDQEKDEIWREFADQIEEGCAADADALLAGIIDRTVAELVLYY